MVVHVFKVMDKTSIKTARYPAGLVTKISEINGPAVNDLLNHYALELRMTQSREIPGSYWRGDEAGLIDNCVYARSATPVHSVLHESCHFICMAPTRRKALHTNAGGDYDEENAVCYLQILLAGQLRDYGSQKMLLDMDAWGYTFRLASAGCWFREDADDARQWLLNKGIIGIDNLPTWNTRAT